MLKSNDEIEINVPIVQVMELFNNQDNFKHWQESLISFKNITDTIGKVGSKRTMKIGVAGTTITMLEEILEKDLPHLWRAQYTTRGVKNIQENRFRESVTNTSHPIQSTIWNSHSEYRFTGMMRIIAKSRPKLFLRQNMIYMKAFKQFAESKYPLSTS